jgi:predicted ester cyclase
MTESNTTPAELVRRLVDEVVNARDGSVLDEIAEGELAAAARRWLDPFGASFPDFRMKVASVVAEGDRVAAHFRCSGTHLGAWRGFEPTGRRFEDVDEVYFFRVRNGRLAGVELVLEDDLGRMKQLGLVDER